MILHCFYRSAFLADILAIIALGFNLVLCSVPQDKDFCRIYANDFKTEDGRVAFRLEVLKSEDDQPVICTSCGYSKPPLSEVTENATNVPKCSHTNVTEEIQNNPVLNSWVVRMRHSIKSAIYRLKKSLKLPAFAQKIATMAGVILVSEMINAVLPAVSFEVPYSLSFGCNANGAQSMSVNL